MDIGIEYKIKTRSLESGDARIRLKGRMKNLVKGMILFLVFVTWFLAPFAIGTLLPVDEFLWWGPRIGGGILLFVLVVGKIVAVQRSGTLMVNKGQHKLSKAGGLRFLPWSEFELPPQTLLAIDSYTRQYRAGTGASASPMSDTIFRLLAVPVESTEEDHLHSVQQTLQDQMHRNNEKLWMQGSHPPLPSDAIQVLDDKSYNSARSIMEAVADVFDWPMVDLVSQGASTDLIPYPQRIQVKQPSRPDDDKIPAAVTIVEQSGNCEIYIEGGMDSIGKFLFTVFCIVVSIARFVLEDGNYVPAAAYAGFLLVLWPGLVSVSIILSPNGIKERIKLFGFIPFWSRMVAWDQVGDVAFQNRRGPWLAVIGNSGEGTLLDVSLMSLIEEDRKWLLARIERYVFELQPSSHE